MSEPCYLLNSGPPPRVAPESLHDRNCVVRGGALRRGASRLRRGALSRGMAAFAYPVLSILLTLGVKNIQWRVSQFHFAGFVAQLRTV